MLYIFAYKMPIAQHFEFRVTCIVNLVSEVQLTKDLVSTVFENKNFNS